MTYTCAPINERFVLKVILVHYAFSLICPLELSDDINLIMPSVKPFFASTVASDIFMSIPGIAVILMLLIEQFCLFNSQKHTFIGSDDTIDRPVC